MSASASTPAAALPRASAASAIGAAGSLCGVLDISAAFTTWYLWRGISPARVLRGVASGWFGAGALQGGSGMAALGLLFHFVVAFSAATMFYLASRKLRYLLNRPVLSGVLYGVAVYLVMYWLVVPLSNYRRSPVALAPTLVAIITHIVCVGLPISLMVRRYSR
jgi:hypothetical protein